MCDGFPDCPGEEDEAQCGVGKFHSFPGLLRCQGEERCVHPYYYNDGISQCKYGDDEVVTFVCPVGCQCFTKGVFCDNTPSEELLRIKPSPQVLCLKYTSLSLPNVFYPVFERTSRLVLSGGSLDRLPQPPFLSHLVILGLEKIWKNSIWCHLGGFLLYFGFQCTVVVKFIIALDRMILLRRAVKRIGLSKLQNTVALTCSVINMCAITVVPFILFLAEIYPDINTESGSIVCMPFLFIYRDTLATAYQSTVFLLVNYVIFTANAVCYGVSMHKVVKSGSDLDHGMGAIIDQGRRRRTNKMLATTTIGFLLSMSGWLVICLMEIIMVSRGTVSVGYLSRETYQYIVLVLLLVNPIADPIIFTVSSNNYLNWLTKSDSN